jgi:hypothetical protein
MGLGDLFKLHRLTIEAFETETRKGKPEVFEVQYNPETLSLRHEASYQTNQVGGPTGRTGVWRHNVPKRLQVNLVVDGTGADSLGIEALIGLPTVAERIRRLIEVCYEPKSGSHEPAYLTLKWKDGVLGAEGFKCRLESVDINYKAFNRDGSPLHAELVCTFVQNLIPPEENAKRKYASPDLTHRRVVMAGDTLPLLCGEIYGSAIHYLRVAQVNELDDFRTLTAGQELFFPPFERPRKK